MIPVPLGFIHAMTGDVHLEIPITTVPQRNQPPFVAKFVYDTSWYRQNGNGYHCLGGSCGLSLQMGNNISAGTVLYNSVSFPCPNSAYPYGSATQYQNFRYVDQDRTVHAISNSL